MSWCLPKWKCPYSWLTLPGTYMQPCIPGHSNPPSNFSKRTPTHGCPLYCRKWQHLCSFTSDYFLTCNQWINACNATSIHCPSFTIYCNATWNIDSSPKLTSMKSPRSSVLLSYLLVNTHTNICWWENMPFAKKDIWRHWSLS